jgi:hypothetical protein
MPAHLIPCRVPWTVSPSGGVSLQYEETDVAPNCIVTFPASRITLDGALDSRFVRLKFVGGAFAKAHWHDDRSGLGSLGYEPVSTNEYNWPFKENWKFGDTCPSPEIYEVIDSDWIASLPPMFQLHRHIIVDGRDGCIEIAAESFEWTEWIWIIGQEISKVILSDPIASGQWPG